MIYEKKISVKLISGFEDMGSQFFKILDKIGVGLADAFNILNAGTEF
jgi:hypothetical protein